MRFLLIKAVHEPCQIKLIHSYPFRASDEAGSAPAQNPMGVFYKEKSNGAHSGWGGEAPLSPKPPRAQRLQINSDNRPTEASPTAPHSVQWDPITRESAHGSAQLKTGSCRLQLPLQYTPKSELGILHRTSKQTRAPPSGGGSARVKRPEGPGRRSERSGPGRREERIKVGGACGERSRLAAPRAALWDA